MRWRLIEFVTFLICAVGVADAQIYEWRDAGGNRHFTNSLVSVPAEQQAVARVIVANVPPPVPSGGTVVTAGPAETPRSEAEVVYDSASLRDRYTEGLRDGLTLAVSVAERPDGGVYISGPLAVVNASAMQPPLLYPSYGSLVTTSFDRGRSRHLTLRMLLQDQFQIDRDGPFVFEPLAPVGLGPNLQVILPRGLPHYRPRRASVAGARVITR